MKLELAIAHHCSENGCRARLLRDQRDLETLYSTGILEHRVEIRPGDLVVVDLAAQPARAVFCFARTHVERVQTSVYTGRHPGSQSPIEGLATSLKTGDWVFATMSHVYDRCVDGLPANPDRLWTEARSMVESLVRPEEPTTEPEPASAHTAHTAVGRASAAGQIEYLTAETERGRQALQEVMDLSYRADYEELPPAWTIVRLVDGVPVCYIVVQPELELAMGSAGVRYAFVNDVATRTDRRREGHFRALMAHTYERLRRAGYALILLHGRYPLYRPLGFEVFTHHSGIFLTPEQIERALGASGGSEDRGLLRFEDYRGIQPDLLVVTSVQAGSAAKCAAVLRAAAALAREKAKARILFEHPPAPCGKRYQAYASPETPFTALARTCGAEVRLQGADPESGAIPDADWIKVLDAAALVEDVLACHAGSAPPLSPPYRTRGGREDGQVILDTDAGAVTIVVRDGRVTAREGIEPSAQVVSWPSGALAQLVTGYRSAETLALLHGIALPPEAQALLSALFPTCWRFSRNESWTFRS